MTTIIDLTNGELKASISFSREIKDPSLIRCLKRLKVANKNCNTITRISNDGPKHCFYFCRYALDEITKEPIFNEEHFRGNGGIIFHGKSNEYVRNFSVQLTPSFGWSIHT